MRTNSYQSGLVLRGMAVGVLAVVFAQAGRAGEPRLISAQSTEQWVRAFQDQTVSSGFSLDFGGGAMATAAIADTELTLAVDRQAGTARMVDYFQQVEPLFLPTAEGPVSTGALTIVTLPGSTGTFDAVTGQFTTEETYRVFYANDLSALGFTNPDRFVDLPGSAQGVIDVASYRIGTLDIGWDGQSALPGLGIDFSYTCELHAVFAPTSSQMLDLNLIPYTENLPVDASVRDPLLAFLDQALDLSNSGGYRLAVRSMNSFIRGVQNSTEIDDSDSTYMIDTARAIIQLLRTESFSAIR